MLVLFAANAMKTIMIGDDIEITIVDIRGDKVRLGITPRRTRYRCTAKRCTRRFSGRTAKAARVKTEDLQSLPRASRR